MTGDHCARTWLAILAAAAALALGQGPAARAADRPHYDVPPGYTRCPRAQAWNGFFKWASVKDATCRDASKFMAAYAAKAAGGFMPKRLAGFRCRIRYWRNADGDIYASRHTCTRGARAIRFYGMV